MSSMVNNFDSMLPEDLKACHTALPKHFSEAKPEDKPSPYSNELIQQAAVQYLIKTDQVSY